MDCVEWLKQELEGKGDVAINIIRGEALKRNFTIRELKEARRALGVKLITTQEGYFWRLEEEKICGF